MNNILKFAIHLKNASMVNREHVIVRKQKAILDCVRLLYKEGLVQSFAVTDTEILIRTRIVDNVCVTSNIELQNHPTRPHPLRYNQIVKLTAKRTEPWFTTKHGIRTLTQCKKEKIGGFFIFSV
jgi:ribosomal protein S8